MTSLRLFMVVPYALMSLGDQKVIGALKRAPRPSIRMMPKGKLSVPLDVWSRVGVPLFSPNGRMFTQMNLSAAEFGGYAPPNNVKASIATDRMGGMMEPVAPLEPVPGGLAALFRDTAMIVLTAESVFGRQNYDVSVDYIDLSALNSKLSDPEQCMNALLLAAQHNDLNLETYFKTGAPSVDAVFNHGQFVQDILEALSNDVNLRWRGSLSEFRTKGFIPDTKDFDLAVEALKRRAATFKCKEIMYAKPYRGTFERQPDRTQGQTVHGSGQPLAPFLKDVHLAEEGELRPEP